GSSTPFRNVRRVNFLMIGISLRLGHDALTTSTLLVAPVGMISGPRKKCLETSSDASTPGYTFLPDTRRVYEIMIARGRPVRIYKVDKWALPWIRVAFD